MECTAYKTEQERKYMRMYVVSDTAQMAET